MRGYCAAAHHSDDYPYFAETIRALDDALLRLGRLDAHGRRIIFGAPPSANLPGDDIVFESEQLARPLWYDSPRNNAVWTFSGHIARELQSRGWSRVHTCPLGYTPAMSTIVRAAVEPNIDVLFYGAPCLRRGRILEPLRSTSLRLHFDSGVFGLERDTLIARSKLVLNLHYYEPAVLEMFRLAHLFANCAAVVTEGGVDEELEALGRQCAHYVKPEHIVDACLWLASDHVARESIAVRGRRAFAELDFVESVRRAIAETEA